jgi:hypothetical protein
MRKGKDMIRTGDLASKAIMEETMAGVMTEEIMATEMETMIITEEMTTIVAEIATGTKLY